MSQGLAHLESGRGIAVSAFVSGLFEISVSIASSNKGEEVLGGP